MRICFSFIILLLVIASQSAAQKSLGTSTGAKPAGSNVKSGEKKDSTTVNVESKINVWTLERQFSTVKPFILDSSTINFHHYNPIFKQVISNNYLGYVGAPYESNLLFGRNNSTSFYFLENLSAYRLEARKTPFYNTTTPFASLKYSQGSQGASNAEQIFDAFYTQNVDSVTNFGFRFHVLNNQSEYNGLEALHKYLNVFASRNTERYNGYLSFVNGTNNLLENGGTTDLITNAAELYTNQNLPSHIVTNNKSFTIFTSHEYLMGEIPFLVKEEADDSIVRDFRPRYAVQYSAEFEHYNRQSIESSVNTTYFDTTYFNTSSNTDSALFNRFSHVFQLKMFEDTTKKFTFGKRVFMENELVKATHPFPDGIRKYTYSNLYLGGEIYNNTNEFLTWNAYVRFALLGRNIGDAILKGTLDKPLIVLGDTTILHAEGWYQDRSANIFQEHWFSNHYQWENNFKKQHEVVIRGNYHLPKFRAGAGVDYALYSNYIYNNISALPDQYNGEFSVLSAWLNKDFVSGRFGWSNKVVWQGVSNDAVLHLPVWSLYSSIYYSHYLFKVMQIQLGAEVYYHTKFMADAYEPSTTRFYLQDKMLTGGYPVINLFGNAKLKRTSAFVQLVHANSMFNFGDYFSAPFYPLEQMAFRFGFYWTFYD